MLAGPIRDYTMPRSSWKRFDILETKPAEQVLLSPRRKNPPRLCILKVTI